MSGYGWGSGTLGIATRTGTVSPSAYVPRPADLSLPDALSEALPQSLRDAVIRVCGGDLSRLEEIRLRAGRCTSLTVAGRNVMTDICLAHSDLFAILTRMCDGSLYAYSQNINEGFVTLAGGVRVGVVGRAACEGGQVIGVHDISALCIRIPHRHGRVGGEICDLLHTLGAPRGILIYAPPGVGKTTLLRGVAARLAGGDEPMRTVVIDTRGELSFSVDGTRLCLDVLTGYPRPLGVEIATRSMGAEVIICDEIGDTDEAMSLVSAHNGGVPLIATAHAGEIGELLRRTGIRLLHEARLFGAYVGISRDGHGGFLYRVTRWEVADGAL